jgi:hypothetical protein
MKIELILLGVIGFVFLIDFIMNSRKKPSIDNVVDQIEGGEPVKTNNPLNYLLKRKKKSYCIHSFNPCSQGFDSLYVLSNND